jgi:DNA helicase-2/ATP-dependent DNA helicase PcrA
MEQTAEMQFLELRRRILRKKFSRMNDRQAEAVFHVNGPLLILAGAGSGKTTVLINRIANLVRYGTSYYSIDVPESLSSEDLHFLQGYLDEKETDEERALSYLSHYPVKPWSVLAITFTNKAAGELKERLSSELGEDAKKIQASTFHSMCVRILRTEIERLGYTRNFTIYDTDDSVRVLKDCLKSMNLDEKMFPPRQVLSMISKAKDGNETPEEMIRLAGDDYRQTVVGKLYQGYQETLKSANAVDFDDIIVLTVQLFQKFPDVLEHYQNLWRYIMVDEYQDTNHTQYLLISLLAQKYQNLCVVGDDDQSIYKFRGANIKNILSFEKQFPNAEVIRLEQNYRCTQNILNAANEVIRHNTERKGKTLWTQNSPGPLVSVTRTMDEQSEASFIAEQILEHVRTGGKFSDNAVLYRMNAQSNAIEKTLMRSAIPYKIVGGIKFYERKEIKDMVSYLSVLNNPADNLRLRRIINEPKRGIGDATILAAQQIANGLGVSLFEVMQDAENYPALSKKSKVLKEFTDILQNLMDHVDEIPLEELFDRLLEESGYQKYLELQGSEGKNRLENVCELKSNIVKYSEEVDHPTLAEFLEEIALYTDLDSWDESSDYVIMMTLHSAKGLEFDNVFIAGMEDGIFPGRQAVVFPSELEEERRLAYVGITRAKKKLFLTAAAQRLLFGQTIRNSISRFALEIPEEYRELADKTIITAAQLKESNNHALRRKMMMQSGRSLGIGMSSGGVATAARHADKTKEQMRLSVGDRVKHKIFGEGTVLSAIPMANDTLVEIAFDQAGSKKIMQNFAKLERA